MAKKKKPYFPNNWKTYYNAPASHFESIPYEQFMDWRVEGWDLPSSIDCVIREHNMKTGKITEHVYQTERHAKNKVKAMMDIGESEFFLCNHEGIHHLYPKHLLKQEDYDDPLN